MPGKPLPAIKKRVARKEKAQAAPVTKRKRPAVRAKVTASEGKKSTPASKQGSNKEQPGLITAHQKAVKGQTGTAAATQKAGPEAPPPRRGKANRRGIRLHPDI